jgi:hypothetical protein
MLNDGGMSCPLPAILPEIPFRVRGRSVRCFFAATTKLTDGARLCLNLKDFRPETVLFGRGCINPRACV